MNRGAKEAFIQGTSAVTEKERRAASDPLVEQHEAQLKERRERLALEKSIRFATANGISIEKYNEIMTQSGNIFHTVSVLPV